MDIRLNAYGIDISNVLWKNNKGNRLLSTYAGVEPFAIANEFQHKTKATRFDRRNKKYVEVDCPIIIRC